MTPPSRQAAVRLGVHLCERLVIDPYQVQSHANCFLAYSTWLQMQEVRQDIIRTKER